MSESDESHSLSNGIAGGQARSTRHCTQSPLTADVGSAAVAKTTLKNAYMAERFVKVLASNSGPH
ncbi:unnamed protein product [Ceratitis capitata]|uniref:(Mediterranean fruit fly) hypothetical protein n=1 Tax=Ceratitis capitata TaxID=7213 RepID=A0A811U5Q0_CERCA|nr:unnamed protein product [Ceratitis capitata]